MPDRFRVPPVLCLDQRQIVGGDHADVRWGTVRRQQASVQRRRVGQPADVLVQDRLLERQLDRPVRAHEPGGDVQVALRCRQPTEFLVDRGAARQHLGEYLVEPVAAGDPGRLVEQPFGVDVGQRGAVRPGVRPKRQRERLRMAGGPRAVHQILRHWREAAGIGHHTLVNLPSLYHEVDARLCLFQRINFRSTDQQSLSRVVGEPPSGRRTP
jgi:hypothetical protein